MPRLGNLQSSFCCLNSSPRIFRIVVKTYVRFPLSLRNFGDLLAECGMDICHETVRRWGTGRPKVPSRSTAPAGQPDGRLPAMGVGPR